MTDETLAPPLISRPRRMPAPRSRRRLAPLLRRRWLAVATMVLAASALFVALTGMRPAYDAYGWLVWGRQAAHLDLNTDAAPSWKPLSFLFTFPYALLTGRGALWLWMVTAVAGAFASAVLAGRVAFVLTGPSPSRRFAPWIAGAFAAGGVLGLSGYWHFILIANSDPLTVALCLAAVDLHLSHRPRWAFAMLVLAALGRPEAAVLALLYGVWLWRAARSARLPVAAGLVVVPLLWLLIPALTSHSALIASDVAAATTDAITGNKLTAVLHGFLGLGPWPMQLAGAAAVLIAAVRRDRTSLVLAGGALLWVAAEVVSAARGLPVAPRYMFEPAAITVVLAGAAAGRLLALAPRRRLPWWGAAAAVLALAVALVPQARQRARLAHNGIVLGHSWTHQITQLHAVIARDGGRRRILACGQAVTDVPHQSILAWELGENVIDVGWFPNTWIASGQPIVLFWPVGAGWRIQPIHTAPDLRRQCAGLATTIE